MSAIKHETVVAMTHEVASLVGDDGTGDLYTVCREALRGDPAATPASIAEIVREAREEAMSEARGGRTAPHQCERAWCIEAAIEGGEGYCAEHAPERE